MEACMDFKHIPRVGRLYAILSVNSGTVVAPIVLPSANPGGIVIRTCQIQVASSTTANGVALYTGTNAPANVGDSSQKIILVGSTPANAPMWSIQQLPYPLFIDPG